MIHEDRTDHVDTRLDTPTCMSPVRSRALPVISLSQRACYMNNELTSQPFNVTDAKSATVSGANGPGTKN